MKSINIDELLNELTSVEKTASDPEKSFMDILTGQDSTEKNHSDASDATNKTELKKVAADNKDNIDPADKEVYEKLANQESTKEKLVEADMIARMYARSYYDELQRLGIFGQVNSPHPGVGGEHIETPFPYGPFNSGMDPKAHSQADHEKKAADLQNEAAEIISELYNRFVK